MGELSQMHAIKDGVNQITAMRAEGGATEVRASGDLRDKGGATGVMRDEGGATGVMRD